ncbi:RING/FYVE/PHD zinc finger superfamily protein [Melia azedarach]|uniref:RING/FYVE/PHD zinc finger superfamily protein n=1 Tax=Melia azedarach TaxID=155640 RepID=A0ACC1XUS6_MELAZ|nr:RING/FYVE/PHD zinc finger superfamily protein [Melia azedarach]
MGKENLSHENAGEVSNEVHSLENADSGMYSRCSLDKEAGLAACRVCHNGETQSDGKQVQKDVEGAKNPGRESGFVEFIGPDGEVFICNADLEMGTCHNQDTVIELGCSCKSDLALVHYACALKWFVNHGSTICEICGHVAKNIRIADFKKVVVSLKDYEALRERTASGEPNPMQLHTSSGVDPDAVAAIRRQRLSEISLWFSPHIYNNNNNNSNSTAVSQVVSEQPLNTVSEEVAPAENPATKWAVEGTGILLATGLLTVTLAWLIAPRVGKKTARSGLHILLGGVCALTVVVFFRFIVLTRIKYGPCTLLGYLVCLLVSCIWHMGFTNAWCAYHMICQYIFNAYINIIILV